MARKKKKKNRQLSFDFLKDDRLPKIFGVFCLLFAIYLTIAFASYVFTWKFDQNFVHNFEWAFFSESNTEIKNSLGKLGAVVSNTLINNWFGVAAIFFIYIFVTIGLNKLKAVPFASYWKNIRNVSVAMLFFSIVLGFFFSNFEFPYGGGFGASVATWLTTFVGNIGVYFLLVASLIIGFIWWANPNVNDINTNVQMGYIRQKAQTFLKDKLPGFNANKKTKEVVSDFTEPLVKAKNPMAKPVAQKVDEDWTYSAQFKEPQEDVEDSSSGEQIAMNLTETPVPQPQTAGKETFLEIEEPAPSAGISNDDMEITEDNRRHSESYDPTLDLSNYEGPGFELLNEYSNNKYEINRAELESNKEMIVETLLNYKIEIIKIKATIGPTVTLYEIIPAPGIRISKIKNLEDDIALSLSALGIRIIAPIPGKGTIGIEVPNKNRQIVSLKEVLKSERFAHAKMDLPIALGKTISNEVFVADLAKMPHLLIAGATGQGKSVGINSILMSLLYKKHPSQVKLVLIDPKKVELFPYAKLEKHFLAYLPGLDEPIVTDTKKVVHTLNSLHIEMDERYNLMKKAQSRNISEYNKKFEARTLNPNNGHRFLPYIVLVIDEFADLIMTAGKEVENPITRLAQLSRAVGIHLIIATQRPSVNIITGVIKANFPARIAYKVTAKVDSRTIIDTGGADQLVGRGDMLLSYGSDLVRLQGAFIDTPEVEEVINHISDQQGYPVPYYLPEFHDDDDEISGTGGIKYSDLDENFKEAARLVVQNQHGSTSMIQRRLKLGYNRAGRIMDQLEATGIVGSSNGSKARDVLIFDEVELERYLEDLERRK